MCSNCHFPAQQLLEGNGASREERDGKMRFISVEVCYPPTLFPNHCHQKQSRVEWHEEHTDDVSDMTSPMTDSWEHGSSLAKCFPVDLNSAGWMSLFSFPIHNNIISHNKKVKKLFPTKVQSDSMQFLNWFNTVALKWKLKHSVQKHIKDHNGN